MLFRSTFIIVTILIFGDFNSVNGQDQPDTGVCPALQQDPWSYEGDNGPQHWGQRYPNCNGNMQSPIALSSSDAVADPNLEELDLNNYDQPISKGMIENNGHTIEVIPDDGISRTMTIDGDEYEMKQFHFHWGSNLSIGSEHTLDGVQYAMEMHLVHKNQDNQYAVIGVLFQQQDDDNDELQKIVDQFDDVKYNGEEAELKSSLSLMKLLPSNLGSYYRYQGSLTTPPCTEGVTWTVLSDTTTVGKAQMEQFRTQLFAVYVGEQEENCELVDNFRPLQPLNGREVSVVNKE